MDEVLTHAITLMNLENLVSARSKYRHKVEHWITQVLEGAMAELRNKQLKESKGVVIAGAWGLEGEKNFLILKLTTIIIS